MTIRDLLPFRPGPRPRRKLRGREATAALTLAVDALMEAYRLTHRHLDPATWLADDEPDALVVICEVDAVLEGALGNVFEQVR